MNFFQRAALLLKNPKNLEGRRQPVYPWIRIDEIPPASCLLFYNGNRVTERAGARWFNHRYWPPAFHAAFYLGNRLFLNVGKFKTIEDLTTELRSKRRVDVVLYTNLTQNQRDKMVRTAMMDTSGHRIGLRFPDYAVTDYLRFLFRRLPPSKKDFCSENVAELFGRAPATGMKSVESWEAAVIAAGGIRTAEVLPLDTAPWDIQEWAEVHPARCEIRTVHVGGDYPF